MWFAWRDVRSSRSEAMLSFEASVGERLSVYLSYYDK